MHNLEKLQPSNKRTGTEALDYEAGEAVIRALRRGVTVSDVARELETSVAALRSSLGTWAIRFAVISGVEPAGSEPK